MKNLLLVVLLVIFQSHLVAEKVKVIKNPKANLFESNYVELKKSNELKESVESGEFLFGISSLVVDEKDNIYVFDDISAKICKYDADFNFIKYFCGKGAGQSEIGEGGFNRQNPVALFYRNKVLCVGDGYGKKIIRFNT